MNKADEKLRLLETRLLQLQQDHVRFGSTISEMVNLVQELKPARSTCDQCVQCDVHDDLASIGGAKGNPSVGVGRGEDAFVDLTVDLMTTPQKHRDQVPDSCDLFGDRMSPVLGSSGTAKRLADMFASAACSQPDADATTDDESLGRSPSLLRFPTRRAVVPLSDGENRLAVLQRPRPVTPPPLKMARRCESPLANESPASRNRFRQTTLTQLYNDELDHTMCIGTDNGYPDQVTVTREMRPPLPPPPPLPLEDSFDRLPLMAKTDNSTSPVRKKEDRKKLIGHDCACCAKFYEDVPPELRHQKMQRCSRHRVRELMPKSPEHFWALDFPNSVELQQRGYGGYGKAQNEPVQRARRKIPLKNERVSARLA